ncbi:UNVERIFIED_CONTAM: hypothetical protein FKN15_063338 [Acipenser sinensis]
MNEWGECVLLFSGVVEDGCDWLMSRTAAGNDGSLYKGVHEPGDWRQSSAELE